MLHRSKELSMSMKDRLMSVKDGLQSLPSETLRFMRSPVGAIVLIAISVGGGILAVTMDWGAIAVMVAFEGPFVLLILLALPCFDVVEIQYQKWLFSQWQNRRDSALKANSAPPPGPVYRSWREMPGPSLGVREKMNNRWYERIFG